LFATTYQIWLSKNFRKFCPGQQKCGCEASPRARYRGHPEEKAKRPWEAIAVVLEARTA